MLVLVFARAVGIPWAGLAGVAAMSAGTAATVMSLAALAVFARDRAVALAGRSGRQFALAANTVALAGGGLLVAVGGSLLAASFAPSHPFGI